MKYILIALLLLPLFYLLSFARYEWKKNKLSSIGSIILAIISITFPTVFMFFR
ncbi:MAG TPA: hypothetical protein VIO64_00815 [Pseudobacteroides sp.]|uniref:hypothetical protein n=1 Tax=Pseudobacteroides sp. TaxID=1968840 RepID=UPI002F945642